MKTQNKTLASSLALVLSLAVTGGACISEGDEDEGDDIENPDEVDAQDDGPIELEASAAGFQADCGRVTCTVRLNRANTKKAKTVGGLVDLLGTGCGLLPNKYGVLCTAAIAVPGAVFGANAGKYYDAGNCYGIRFNKLPLPPPSPPALAKPVQVKRGTYNCQ